MLGAAISARDAGASACELLDRTFLDVAARGATATVATVPMPATEAVLLAEVEGDDAGDARRDGAAALGSAFARGRRARRARRARRRAAEHALWALRHAASPILARLDPSLKSMQFIEDGACRPSGSPSTCAACAPRSTGRRSAA